MTMVMRPGESIDDLILSGDGACPVCGGAVRKWGYGRWRVVRGTDVADFRPSRVRCIECRVTQVVLPADVLVRRRDPVVVVGRAWRAFVNGAGARRVARDLDVPMETVRGWLRRLRARAGALTGRSHSPSSDQGRRHLRLALGLIEAEAEVAGCHLEADLWRFAAYRFQGRLLSTPTDPV